VIYLLYNAVVKDKDDKMSGGKNLCQDCQTSGSECKTIFTISAHFNLCRRVSFAILLIPTHFFA